jgi:hypothetical protein
MFDFYCYKLSVMISEAQKGNEENDGNTMETEAARHGDQQRMRWASEKSRGDTISLPLLSFALSLFVSSSVLSSSSPAWMCVCVQVVLFFFSVFSFVVSHYCLVDASSVSLSFSTTCALVQRVLRCAQNDGVFLLLLFFFFFLLFLK